VAQWAIDRHRGKDSTECNVVHQKGGGLIRMGDLTKMIGVWFFRFNFTTEDEFGGKEV